jgi:hypothetical protein
LNIGTDVPRRVNVASTFTPAAQKIDRFSVDLCDTAAQAH